MDLTINQLNKCKLDKKSIRPLMDDELKRVGGGIPTPDRMFHIRREYQFISRGRGHHQP